MRRRLDQIKGLQYSVWVAPVADPQLPAWAIDAISNSPSACAIVLVGLLLRKSLEKHLTDLIKAMKMLAVALQADRVTDSQIRDIRESAPRPKTQRRTVKTDPQALPPQRTPGG